MKLLLALFAITVSAFAQAPDIPQAAPVGLVPLTYSQLTTSPHNADKNGDEVYCTDCTATNPIAGSGSGAVARRENGAWNAGGGGGSGSCSGDINSGCSQVTGTHLASALPRAQGGTNNTAGNVPQLFFGTAAPGSVSGNLPGDLFSDTTNHNLYQCNATSGTSAPACTSVTAGGWALLNTPSGGSVSTAAVKNVEACVPASASGTAYTCSLTTAPSGWSDLQGTLFSFKPDVTNTGSAPTLNPNSLGAKTIIHRDGSGLVASELVVGTVYQASYDGTSVELLGANLVGDGVLITTNYAVSPPTISAVTSPGGLCATASACQWTGLQSSTSSSSQTLTAPSAILCNANNVQITAASVITLTSTPTIAAAAHDGTPCNITNVGSNAITLQDKANLASSLMSFGGSNVAVGAGQSLTLWFNSTTGFWANSVASSSGGTTLTDASGSDYGHWAPFGYGAAGGSFTFGAGGTTYFIELPPGPLITVNRVVMSDTGPGGTHYWATALYDKTCSTLLAQTNGLAFTGGNFDANSLTGNYQLQPNTTYYLAFSSDASGGSLTGAGWANSGYGANLLFNPSSGGSVFRYFTGNATSWSGGTPTFPSTCGSRTAVAQPIPLLMFYRH